MRLDMHMKGDGTASYCASRQQCYGAAIAAGSVWLSNAGMTDMLCDAAMMMMTMAMRPFCSAFVRTASLLPVLLVLAIIGFEYFEFVIVRAVNGALLHEGSRGGTALQLLAFHGFLALAVVSFARVVLTDPGYVTREMLEEIQDELESAMEAQGVDQSALQNLARMPYCRRCKQAKPMRAHHCSMCDKCVLRMDHHCPWVANCIGAGNYKYFLLFVTYALLTTLTIVLTFFRKFRRAFTDHITSEDDYDLSLSGILAVVVAIALSLSLLIFVCVHGSLLHFGASTVECHIFGIKSPYNRGMRSNCRVVFGDGPVWQWLLPIPVRRHYHSQAATYLAEAQRFHAEELVGDHDGEEVDRFL